MGSSSETDQGEGLSTSSDEDLQLAKKTKNKRERKHYRPQDDDGEVFDLEDSEDFSCTSEDSSDAGRNKTNKRRKPLSLNAEEKSDTNTNENYDEDEVALQQAIALSMAGKEDISNSERLASNSEAGPSGQWIDFDAEDEAMKQALAHSLSDQSPLAGAENEEKQLRGKIKKLDLAEGGIGEGDGKSRAVKINNRSAGQVSSIQSRKGVKAAFPAPSLDIVQQAFQMLDPTGSGTLNPVALREVASKLLHKDLDDDQLDAMMEFADTMSHSEGGSSSPDNRLVNAEAFCRLVARFASPE